MLGLPLAETVTFQTRLQSGNRLQVPVAVRAYHKLEPREILHVYVRAVDSFHEQEFYAPLTKDGRIHIPKVTIEVLDEILGESLQPGDILSVTLNGEDDE